MVYTEGNWAESKYHLVRQLLVEHQGTYHFFAIMNYLKNNDDNSVKPAYYAGTQTQWEEVRVKYLEVVNDEIEQFLEEISNFDVFEDPILLDHLHNYHESINLGNAVSTVGHSQGTLYTNFAYDVLVNEDDTGSYYNVSAFGTIADRVASAEDNMRNGSAAYVLDENDDSMYLSIFGHLPFNANNTNVPAGDSPHIFPSYINGNDTAPKIYTMIKNQLQENIDRPSRWSILDENDEITKKGTSDYRVKIVYGDKTVDNILPFGSGEKDKIHYVSIKGSDEKMLIKGSCQATSIIDHTNDEPEDELIINGEKVLYELEGTEQYIFGEMSCKAPSLFEVISQENENTIDWRVTVKNIETDEITESVYPFNLQGSLYQLDSREWVLATCGGIAIEPDWVGKTENEFYKLIGTEEVIKGEMDECNNAPYKPEHFEISWDLAIEEGNGKFVYYHSNPQEQGARLGFSISAVDQDGYMFTDIDNNCYPEDVNVTISFDTFGEKSLRSVIQPKDDNTSLALLEPLQDSGNQYSFLINTSEFVNGHTRKEYKMNFERAVNRAKNPLKLTITDVDISFAGAIGNNSDDKDVTFVYASAYVPDRNIPRGYDEVNTKVYYEVYCKSFSKRDFDITGYSSVDRYGWYILAGDNNLDFDNPLSSYSKIGISKYSKDYIQSVKNAGAPLGTTVTYTPKGYLLYDEYRSDIKTHSFKLRYQ